MNNKSDHSSFRENNNFQKKKAIELSKKFLKAKNYLKKSLSEQDIKNIITSISSDNKVIDFNKAKSKLMKKRIDNSHLYVENKEAGLKAFITKDKNLLSTYYKMRNDIFHKDRGWKNKEWFESEHDKKGHIIVILDNNDNLVGGARLMVSENGELLSGEVENSKYLYKNLFEKIGGDINAKYSEIDGLVVAPEKRDRTVTDSVLSACIKKSLELGCKYIVAIANPVYCRIYRQAYKSVGYGNVKILKNDIWTQISDYNYSKDCPIINIIN